MSQQAYFCPDKTRVCQDKSFVATKIILVTAPASDRGRAGRDGGGGGGVGVEMKKQPKLLFPGDVLSGETLSWFVFHVMNSTTTTTTIIIIIIIIMYIYHALINALSAHKIHINLNMIFYTHVEHSPTKTIYIKYYKIYIKNALQTHTCTHTIQERV